MHCALAMCGASLETLPSISCATLLSTPGDAGRHGHVSTTCTWGLREEANLEQNPNPCGRVDTGAALDT